MRPHSLRLELTAALLGALTVTGGLAALAIYSNARQEVDEMFDYELRAVAQSVESFSAPAGMVDAIGRIPDDEVLVQLWSPDAHLLYRSNPAVLAPYSAADGYALLSVAAGTFRSYTRHSNGRVVQVAQTLGMRRELALELSLRLVAPLLFGLPLLGLATWWFVRRALAPVGRLGESLSARTDDMLEPVPARRLPAELVPLVDGFNRLLQRLGEALAAQRALVADAAHELRTPLAVVRLQAQTLQRIQSPAEAAEAHAALAGGIDRATRLVQQLLTLARHEPVASAMPVETVRLDRLCREVLAELVPMAQDKQIDLGLESAISAEIAGDPAALQALIGNLVDNAIRYTPDGGRVAVMLSEAGDHVLLSVQDTGPGIPAGQKLLVQKRFYRIPGSASGGSGLGLAIAAAVVQRQGGQLELKDAPGGGLRVEVLLPLRRP